MYLLNHRRVPASDLAKYFEMSVRTIQRDMDSLCFAGVPVLSIPGAFAGYEISDCFRFDAQMAAASDYSYILTALRELISAAGHPKALHAPENLGDPIEILAPESIRQRVLQAN